MLVSRSLLAVALVGVMSACGGASAEPLGDERPLVVVSTPIWADVVSNVACDGIARIDTLITPGGDPHAFEPSLADRATMEHAALIVVNGLGLEVGLADTIEAVEASGTPVLRVGHFLGANPDPHVWFDSQLVTSALPLIAQGLVEFGGVDGAAIEVCAASYEAELVDLDEDIEELVANLPAGRRRLVTDHHMLGYFADRYDFELVGSVSPASPVHLEELAVAMEQENVSVIFTDSGHSVADAQALASRVGGVEIVSIDSGASDDTYIGWLRTTLETIIDALA